MTSGNKDFDDLTKIKGIGETRQGWLRESMGVQTYEDLANLSVDEIQVQLKADKKSAPKGVIENWITEAETFAASARLAQEVEAPVTGIDPEKGGKSTTVIEETTESTVPPIGNATPSNGGWKEYAQFYVKFEERETEGTHKKQTTAQVLGEDETTWMPPKSWEGIEKDGLFKWMLEQAGEEDWPESLEPTIPEPAPEEPPKPNKQPIPEEPVKVRITHVRLFQPPKSGTPVAISEAGEPFPEPIKAGEPFALKLSFSLIGEAAASVAHESTTYLARIIAFERTAKKRKPLGDTAQRALAENNLDYTVEIPEVTLETGSYQLGTLVRVQAENTVPDFMEVSELVVQ